MKKNMVPLLAIAFVVAIISTGVFYGLFAGRLRSNAPDLIPQRVVVASRNLEQGTVLQPEDVAISEVRLPATMKGPLSKPEEAVGSTLMDPVQEGEPITQRRLASKDIGGGVPQGMRAVSIRVTDSTGLVTSLRPGVRVDVQAVSGREGAVQLRTILQNVEVLSVNPRTEQKGEGGAVPVAAILVRPQDTDTIALADSGARVRLALRNPRDSDVQSRHAIGLAALFQPSAKSSFPVLDETKAGGTRDRSTATTGEIQFSVQLIGAGAAALKEIDSKLAGPRGSDSARVASFPAGLDATELVQGLARQHQLEILSASQLTAAAHQPVTFKAGSASCRLRVQFLAGTNQGATSRVRVKPELTWNLAEGGVETRIFETEVSGQSDFILSEFVKSAGDRAVLDQLFPGRSWSARDLVIVVHIQPPKRLQAAAVSKPNRRP